MHSWSSRQPETLKIDVHALHKQRRADPAQLRHAGTIGSGSTHRHLNAIAKCVLNEAGETAGADLDEDPGPALVHRENKRTESHRLPQVIQRDGPNRLRA